MQSHTCLAAEGRRARAAKALIGSRRELLAIAAAIRSESITVISDYKIDEVLRSYVEWPWHGLGWKCEGYLEKVSGAESLLRSVDEDMSSKTAEELATLASDLVNYDDGILLSSVEEVIELQPLLRAAVKRHQWQSTHRSDENCPMELWRLIDESTAHNAERLLTGDDKTFFDSLPKILNLYRGCSSVELRRDAAFFEWGTNYTSAERVALIAAELDGGDPIVLWATVLKTRVRTVSAKDSIILAKPCSARVIDCRREFAMRADCAPESQRALADQATA